MRDEPREEDKNVNVVLRRGILTVNDKGKQLEEDGCVCKAPKKEVDFDFAQMKETFRKPRRGFMRPPPREARKWYKKLTCLERLIPMCLTHSWRLV